MELRSVAALIEASRKMPIWEAILCSDLEEDTPEQRAASLEKMQMLWQVMQDSAAGYDGSQRSLSGLSGGADSLPERIPRYTGGGDAPRPLRDRRLWKYHC